MRVSIIYDFIIISFIPRQLKQMEFSFLFSNSYIIRDMKNVETPVIMTAITPSAITSVQ